MVHVAPPQVDVSLSFTSGMGTLRGHPDVVVFDMPAPSAAHYLNALGERVRAGADLRAGHILDGLHRSFRLALLDVRDDDFLALLARWDLARRRNPAAPLLQLVWPDLCGTLPWEPGCNLTASGLRQPLLGAWPGRGERAPARAVGGDRR